MAVSDIKNQAAKVIGHLPIPRLHLALVGVLSMGLALLSVFPSKDASAVRLTENIQIPELEAEIDAVAARPEQIKTQFTNINTPVSNASMPELATPANDIVFEINDEPVWESKETVVKTGDNLSKVFARAGLNDRDMFELIHSNKKAKQLAKLYPGNKFVFEIDDEGQLQKLTHIESRLLSQKLYSRRKRL